MPHDIYRKQRADAPAGLFAWEAAGLDWLRVPGGPPVVEVVEVAAGHLDLARLTEVAPSRRAAREFGGRLAVLHAAGAPRFGSPPAGWAGGGFFGPLDRPYPTPPGERDAWGPFLADLRIEPMVAAGLRTGAFSAADAVMLRELAAVLRRGDLDDDEPPARLHGDLWAGNVLWTPTGATLIDPAAHGGHRESDLAMLALFGCPHLDEVLTGYQHVHPLRPGWQHRVGLHQVYPVGMHAVLFGGGYAAQLRRLVRPLLG